ncbi:hypothetical protein CERZMDRAFT_80891 [Cercospora zeae-maydis SCOH1-5]|uniref:Uncharacterized protein n=1 Tax=Cercospora zeae-maydis SCOH1-5 TaxID=717836 RepID=A0A6A6FU13_9PEZI|nr:hypothetical protein CERZMDRAFT_80891 [Cercospora zeae-maydis SCOH1-5]
MRRFLQLTANDELKVRAYNPPPEMTVEDRIQNLCQELQAMILDYTLFVEPSTVAITDAYRPPWQLSVNRRTRPIVAEHFYSTSTFSDNTARLNLQHWLDGLPEAHTPMLTKVDFGDLHSAAGGAFQDRTSTWGPAGLVYKEQQVPMGSGVGVCQLEGCCDAGGPRDAWGELLRALTAVGGTASANMIPEHESRQYDAARRRQVERSMSPATLVPLGGFVLSQRSTAPSSPDVRSSRHLAKEFVPWQLYMLVKTDSRLADLQYEILTAELGGTLASWKSVKQILFAVCPLKEEDEVINMGLLSVSGIDKRMKELTGMSDAPIDSEADQDE